MRRRVTLPIVRFSTLSMAQFEFVLSFAARAQATPYCNYDGCEQRIQLYFLLGISLIEPARHLIGCRESPYGGESGQSASRAEVNKTGSAGPICSRQWRLDCEFHADNVS